MTKTTRGYNVWSVEEEAALRDGVKKHGLGAWEVIRKDPEFIVLECVGFGDSSCLKLSVCRVVCFASCTKLRCLPQSN